MSAPLPREPRPGERLDADWGRAVARALRSQRLSGGPGVRVSSGPDGTTVSIPAGAPGSGEGAAERPMPLDLSLAASGEEARALVRVAGFSARRGADALPVDSARCAGLASAVSGGAEFWDAGAVSSAKGFCLYVADVADPAAEDYSPDIRWGVATGASVAAAVEAIPPSGVLLALPVGAVSAGGDVLQLFHGCVALAPPEGGVPDGTAPGQILVWNGTAWAPAAVVRKTVVTGVFYDEDDHMLYETRETITAIAAAQAQNREITTATAHSTTMDID